MDAIETELFEAIELHRTNRFAEAEQRYREILSRNPNLATAWHYLGLIYLQHGQPKQAIPYLQQSLSVTPDQPDVQSNLGVAFLDAALPEEAISVLKSAIATKPDHVAACTNLGNALKALNRHQEALPLYEKAYKLAPESPQVQNNFGVALQSVGRWEESIPFLRLASKLPHYEKPHFNLGLALQHLGRAAEALMAFQESIRSKPDYPEAYKQIAMIHLSLGDNAAAIEAIQRAIAIRPDYSEAYVDLGMAFGQLDRKSDAIKAFQAAIHYNPSSAEAYYNLGVLHLDEADQESSRQFLTKANEFKPGIADAELWRIAQSQLDWQEATSLYQRLLPAVTADSLPDGFAMSPMMLILNPEVLDPSLQLSYARKWSQKLERAIKPLPPAANAPRALIVNRRLRLGYLSADFHEHATARLITEMLEYHDRERFQIFAYSFGPDDGSPLRQRIIAACDRFQDIAPCSHAAAAQRIRDDQVDILIDLKGYTFKARTEILAFRPAPIQVNFLGYPGSMGASFIDYVIADRFIIPESKHNDYQEKVAYIDGCYQPNDSTLTANVKPVKRAVVGLPEDAIVCCSFNNPYKLHPPLLKLWARMMRENPAIILWLIESSVNVARRLRAFFEQEGVSSERLNFAVACNNTEHLSRLATADLFLDSFPVNAHTTASDALRMNVPLVTRIGETFVSRVAGSLLHYLGLDEWIANDWDQYFSVMKRLTESHETIAVAKHRLQQAVDATDLFDGKSYAKKLERTLVDVWTSR